MGKGNPPHFCGLCSEVTNFFNRNCMKLCIVVESTVNYCHYESDTTIIRMTLSREIQWLCFYAWFVGQIIDSNGCTFTFFEYYTKCMYFQWTGCSKINPTNQFDHVCVQKRIQKGCKVAIRLFYGWFKIIGAKTVFCVKFLL